MERRTHYYVSRQNPLTWLMALCMVASAVARIALPGMKGSGEGFLVWCQILLPIAAPLLFGAIALLNGKEHLYKTAIPVWMMTIYACLWVRDRIAGTMMVWLFWIALVAFAGCYTHLISGKSRYGVWLLVPVVLAPVSFLAYFYRESLIARDWAGVLPVLPDLLALLGALFLTFALRVHPQGEYHPTWGDRPDGRRVRTLDPMSQITSYFQVERNTCSNLFEESLEISNVERYIRQKRREGYTDFGITHVLLAAYVRGIAKYPQLNRFVSGQKVYSRGEDIVYCMTIKKDMTIESPDSAIKVHLSPRDTALDVYRKFNAAVAEVKQAQESEASLDGVIGAFTMIPGVFLKFTIWLLKLLDYFGWVPKFLLEVSPFHGSLYFTSMGSLGIRPVYHHLYDFGNLPAFGAFGMKRKAYEVQEDGSVVQKKYIDMKFTLDERICDGYYYATFFKYYRRLIAHPEVLDNPPETIVKDID